MNKGRFIALFFSLSLLSFCKTYQQKVSNQNLSFIYKKEAGKLHPRYTVFHVSDSITELHFSVAAKELLFSREGGHADLTARLRIDCKLSASYESTVAIDTASARIEKSGEPAGELSGSIRLRALAGHTRLLEVTATDLNRSQSSKTYIDIEKTSPLGAQNFLTLTPTGEPLFRNHVAANEELSIRYRSKGARTLIVSCYKREFPLALPPFSVTPPKAFDYKADSTFTVSTDENGTATLRLRSLGFYHVRLDTLKKEGLTLYRYYDNFPEIKSADQLIYPMRYITSRQEYEELEKAASPKAAADNFWLKSAGSPERARELIRKFYTRVADANAFFSSYLEGWKTDRGMIYLIYGAPNFIYRSGTRESWVYGEENTMMSITYTFNRLDNPFSNNDYQLERSTAFKDSWYRAVDTWRQGRVFIEN